jgi:hypothetical protein
MRGDLRFQRFTRLLGNLSFMLLLALGLRPQLFAQTVSLSPSQLNFGSQAVGTTSSVRSARLTNTGTAPLVISSITPPSAPSPFSMSHNCPLSPAVLAPNAHCTISVVFSPVSTGSMMGSISIADNASGSPQSIGLNGTGVYPVTLSPNPLSFGNVTLGNSSTKSVTLRNGLNAALTVSSIMATGNFSQTNNCPMSPNTLAAGLTCSISVVFTPSALGAASGTLTVNHNAYGSPTSASLSGNGTSPVVLSPISLVFGSQRIGTKSGSRTIQVTNAQPVTLSITSIQTTGDFSQTNNCPVPPAALAASGSSGSSCSVMLTFSPTAAGARASQLSVFDNAITSPQTAALSGTGVAVLQSIAVAPSTATIGVGQNQSFTATGSFNDGSQQDLTASASWSSSNSAIATVSKGLASGKRAGTATIRASQSGVSGTATLNVTSVAPPVITSFTAGASTITAGNSTTLTANFSGGTGSINNGVGAATSGTPVTVTPASTTTYLLTVTNSAGTSVTASATVTVVPPPVVNSFSAGASTITAGNSTTLTANFTGGTGSINNGIGAVTSGTPVTVTPATSTTYMLTVTNSAGTSVTASATVTVVAAPAITSFTAGASAVTPGNSTTLTGVFSGGNGSIDNGVGPVASGSAVTVTPASTTTYTLTVTNSAGSTATSTVTVSVVDGVFSVVGNLDVVNHTATLLNNGLVLIAGGYTTASPRSPVPPQLYNPANGTLTATGSMSIPRSQHQAILLNNGTVLITGGNDASANPTYVVEVYDPVAGTFTAVGNSPAYFSANTATLLNDGTVLLAGGSQGVYGNATNTAWIFNPGNNSFTQVGNLNNARHNHTATLLSNGQVLIAGGQDAGFNSLATAELYDPTAQTFTLTNNMNNARAFHTATLLNDGRALLAGCDGSATPSAELFDPTAGAFTLTGSMSYAHCYYAATLLSNGTVLNPGGYDTSANPTFVAEVYDPVAGAFTVTSSMSVGRYNFTATRLGNGTVFVVGGFTTGATPVEVYTPSTLTPANLVSITVGASSQTIAAIGGTQRFIATGTFSDSSTHPLAALTWSATDRAGTNVAQISNDATNPGVALAQSQGTATITACAGTICGSTTLTVGVLTYTQLAPASSPGPRCCMAMAFDPGSSSTLLFGGVETFDNATYSAVSDTWQLQGGQWSQLSLGTAPSPREGAAMVYDAATNTVVLFGGSTTLFGTCCGDLNDTWVWNGATTTWTQMVASGDPNSPPARRFDGQGLAYDPNTGTVVLFGGVTQAGTFLGDTWTWNGTAWTPQSPAASPSPRVGQGITTDAAGNVVLFGGGNSSGALADTWVWNGATWQQQFPAASPPARSSHALALDAALNEVVLFGGYGFTDTWTWNGTNWTQMFPSAAPHDRYAFGMDYDSAAQALVIFGGFSSGPALNDTWELGLAP